MRLVAFGAALAVTGLAACEPFEFNDLTTEDAAFTALQDETALIAEELESYAVTPVANIPVTGSAAYSGTALIALDTPDRASELIGTATLVAEFGTGADTLTGTLDGFYGTINGGDVDSFDGEIDLTSGRIDRTDTTVIAAAADGTLRSDTDTLNVGADLDGNFLGLTPEGLSLVSNDDSVFRLNGSTVSGSEMEVLGLRD